MAVGFAALPALAQAPTPTPAAAGDAAPTVLLLYRVEIAGTYGLRIDAIVRQSGDRYSIHANVRKEGIFATFTSKYRSENQAAGRIGANGALPSFGFGRIVLSDDLRSYRFIYAGNGSYTVVDEPKHEFQPDRIITEAQRRGSYDPLTAVAVALLGRPDPCGGPIPIFDSRRRFDLLPQPVATSKLPAQDGPKPVGDVRRCDVTMKKIAGYKAGSDKDDVKATPSRLWLAKFDDSARYYPARIEVDTGFGQLVGWLESFQTRPQTAEDKEALAK